MFCLIVNLVLQSPFVYFRSGFHCLIFICILFQEYTLQKSDHWCIQFKRMVLDINSLTSSTNARNYSWIIFFIKVKDLITKYIFASKISIGKIHRYCSSLNNCRGSRGLIVRSGKQIFFSNSYNRLKSGRFFPKIRGWPPPPPSPTIQYGRVWPKWIPSKLALKRFMKFSFKTNFRQFVQRTNVC